MWYNVASRYTVYPKAREGDFHSKPRKNVQTCCFIGHRTVNETEALKTKLTQTIERLILHEKVDTFLFGSKSRFNDLCLELVTELKETYPHIRRVNVRAEYPRITQEYHAYLMKFYEDTYFPPSIEGAGRASYVKRNREMIDNSRFCIFYYNERHIPDNRKSGTQLALDYAMAQGKSVLVV